MIVPYHAPHTIGRGRWARCAWVLACALYVLVGSQASAETMSAAAPFRDLEGIEEVQYAKNTSTQVVTTSENGVTLEVRNGNILPPTTTLRRAMGYYLVAAPPEATINYTVEEGEWELWQAGRLVGTYAYDEESPYGPLPARLQRVQGSPVDTYRGVGLVQLHVQWTEPMADRAGGPGPTMAVIRWLRVRADFQGGILNAEDPAEMRDPALMKMMRRAVANAEQAPELYRPAPALTNLTELEDWNRILRDAAKQGAVAFFQIPRPGLHRITQVELERIGVDPRSLDPKRVRVFVGKTEVPIEVRTDVPGMFLGNAQVIFYVPEQEEKRKPYIPVWMFQLSEDLGLSPPKRVEVIENAQVAMSTEPSSLITDIPLVQPRHFELRGPFAPESGYWSLMNVEAGTHEEVTFTVENPRPDKDATLEISFGGIDNHVSPMAEVFLNETQIGVREIFSGRGPIPKTIPIPRGVLRDGRNTLSVRHPIGDGSRQARVLLVSSAKVRYYPDERSIPPNQLVRIEGLEGQTILLESDPNPLIGTTSVLFAWDITDPYNPKSVTAQQVTRSQTSRINGRVTLGPSGAASMIFGAEDALFFPAHGQSLKYSELMTPPEGADILVIAHDSLAPAMEDYVELRQSDGYRVRVVTTTQLYAAMSFGDKRYQSVQELLRHAYRTWPGDRIRYALLVGEASEFWWDLTYPDATLSPNQLPAYGWADPAVQIRCDEQYGQIIGTGAMADVEVGRFPVRDEAELKALLQRIRVYEETPEPGPWQVRHLFVADDETEFARVGEKIIGTELVGNAQADRLYLQTFPYEDYFRIFQRKRSSDLTDAIVRELSAGALTATYLGHGGPNLWSGERIFHYRDIYRLSSGGRRPIMTAASCDTAWIDYPVEPVSRSLGEQFLLSENGGAIGIFAPVGGTSSFEHDFLLRPFYHALTQTDTETLGGLTAYAKMAYLRDRNRAYVANQYILLGDPALKIPRPGTSIQARVAPGQAFAGDKSGTTISGEVAGVAFGLVEAVLLNSFGDVVAGPARARIQNTRFELRLPLPAELRPGEHRLSIRATNRDQGQFETLSVPFPVRESRVSVTWNPKSPIPVLMEPGATTEVELLLENGDEVPVSGLLLQIVDRTTDRVLTEAPLALEAGQRVVRAFNLPAPEAVMTVEARVRYASTPESEPISSDTFELKTRQDGPLPVSVPPGLVAVERSADTGKTTIRIPIYYLGSTPLPALQGSLYLMDHPDGSLIAGPHRIFNVLPGEPVPMELVADILFPEGVHPFRLALRSETALTEDAEVTTRTLPLPIKIPAGTDLAVVPGSVRAENTQYVSSQTVYVRALIRNEGTGTAHDVQCRLFVGAPWWPDAKAPAIQDQSTVVLSGALAPGEEREVRLRWDPEKSETGDVTLYVVANSDRRLQESTYLNNVGDTRVNFRRNPNLAVLRDAVGASQHYIREGDVVTVTVPFQNTSPFDFPRQFALRLTATGGPGSETRITRPLFAALDAGEMAVVQVPWRVEGQHNRVSISLNDDKEYAEAVGGDNLATLEFDYVLMAKELQESDQWAFRKHLALGKQTDVNYLPTGDVELSPRPTQARTLTFSNEYILGPPLPTERSSRTEGDERMAILPDGSLHWTAYEMPPPVSFRIPMPTDDRTTLYDITMAQIGNRTPDGKTTNEYRYRVEQESNWREPAERVKWDESLGRVETYDDSLDITFASGAVPSWNQIFFFQARPVQGVYESPVVETQGLREGNFEAIVAEEGGRIEFDIRTGTGDRFDPQWSEWQPIWSGDPLPSGRDVRTVQWRATVIGTESGLPRIENVLFRFRDAAEVAANLEAKAP